MADFPLSGGSEIVQAGFNLTGVIGQSITANSTTHTKGAYVELLSAANNNSDSINIEIFMTPNGNSNFGLLLDVAIGGAGSEVVIIPNLFISPDINNSWSFSFPINIAAGQRISARCQSGTSSYVVSSHILLTKGSFTSSAGFSEVVAIGVNTADSGGTIVVRGAINTYGAWTEITASTPDEYQELLISATRPQSSWGNANVTYQLAVGGAGNEEIIISNQQIKMTTAESGGGLVSKIRKITIPKGVRLSIRAAATVANADFDLDYIIYGVK